LRELNSLFSVFRRSRRVTVGTLILIVLIVVALLHGPIVNFIGRNSPGITPLDIGFGPKFQPASKQFLLGTDNQGHDELAEVVTGLWTSIQIGVEAGVLSTIIGVLIAFYAAYRGGILDSILSTTTDLFLVIPSLPLLIAFAGYAKTTTIPEIALILAVFSWAGAARTIRSHVLSLRTRSFVDLAKVSKESTFEIVVTELMPNMLPYLVLGLTYATIGAIFALVGLEVIGLGPSGIIDLGFLISDALGDGATTLGLWYDLVAPIFLITLLFFALNMINLGLEEVFNPRLRKVVGA
jgi:peptide/nickel transport system permease protein